MTPAHITSKPSGRVRCALALVCAVLSILLAIGQTSMGVAAAHPVGSNEVQLSDGGWAEACVVQNACQDAKDIAYGLSHDEVPVPHHHHHVDTHWGVESDFAGYPFDVLSLAAAAHAALVNGVEQSPTSVIEQPPRA